MNLINQKTFFDIYYHKLKPALFAALLHLVIFFSLFSFEKPLVDISFSQNSSSFNMVSFSAAKEESSEVKRKEKVRDNLQKTAENLSQSSKQIQADSSSSSEVIFDDKSLDNPQPQYPLLAKRKGEEGTVLIRAFVDEKGNASKVEVAKSSSFSLLDNAAIEAIKKWHFVPAKRLGQFVTSSVIIPITFKLT